MADRTLISPIFSELMTADEAAIDAFLDQKIRENGTLDYKRDTPSDLASPVGAMANTDGGVILIGVGEDKQTKEPSDRPGVRSNTDPAGAVTSAVRAMLEPPPEISTHVVPRSDGSSYVVVKVTPSTQRIVLHREKGILVRFLDQSIPPGRAELERLIRRELSPARAAAGARDAAAGDLIHWGGGTSSDGRISIVAAFRPTEPVDVPLDYESDAALQGAANDLLLTGWAMERDPDATRLSRQNDWAQFPESVTMQRDGSVLVRYIFERPGWESEPRYIIHAGNLASDIVAVLLLPFALARRDARFAEIAWAASVTVTDYEHRKIVVGTPRPEDLPSKRDNLPKVQRSGLLVQPSDALPIAGAIIKDIARMHDTGNVSGWLGDLDAEVVRRNERLEPFKGSLRP